MQQAAGVVPTHCLIIMDADAVAYPLPHLSPIQATLQGPSPSIRLEAASRNDEKRYDDRAGLEGFAVRAAYGGSVLCGGG